MIAGDEEILLTSYAINRKVLLELDAKQNMDKFQSFGVENIQYVDDYSKVNSSFLAGVGVNFIVFFKLEHTPPAIYCSLDRKDSVKSNLLVTINSTSCPSNNNEEQLLSIC